MQSSPQPPSGGTDAAFKSTWRTRGPQGGDDARHDEPAGGVDDEGDRVVEAGRLDVGDDRGDLVIDAEGRKVARLAVAARQVHCQRRLVEERHQPIPVAGGRAAAVHKDVGHRLNVDATG